MRAYIINQREMEALRDKLQLAFLRHCEHYYLQPNLRGRADEHSTELYASINYAFCGWLSDVGGAHHMTLEPSPRDVLALDIGWERGYAISDYIASLGAKYEGMTREESEARALDNLRRHAIPRPPIAGDAASSPDATDKDG